MNNIRIYAFFWMIVLLTVSCYEDKEIMTIIRSMK